MKDCCEKCFKEVEKALLSNDLLCPECAEEFEELLDDDRQELNPEDFSEDDIADEDYDAGFEHKDK